MALHLLLGIPPVALCQAMTASEKRGNANRKFSAEVIAAALADLDAGATLIATSKKHGITDKYLCTLKNNRQRRRDAQAKR